MDKDKDEYRIRQEKLFETRRAGRVLFHKKLKDAFKIIWRNPDKIKEPNNEWDLYATPSTNEGWDDIIWECSTKLETLCKEAALVIPFEKLPVASQIKEKFGTLRFNIDHLSEDYPSDFKNDLRTIIALAENKSMTICEKCGQNGCIRQETPDKFETHYWLKTLCTECWYKETFETVDYNILFSSADRKDAFEKRKQNLLEMFKREKGEDRS